MAQSQSTSFSLAVQAGAVCPIPSVQVEPVSATGASYGSYPGVDRSYAPQLLPSISYAVDHGSPGAAASFARLIAVGDWQEVLDMAPTGIAAPYADQYDCPNWSFGPRA